MMEDVVMHDQIAHWIDRYYKPDRLNPLPGRRERIIEDRMLDVERSGWTLISRHDSVTGKAEVFDVRG